MQRFQNDRPRGPSRHTGAPLRSVSMRALGFNKRTKLVFPTPASIFNKRTNSISIWLYPQGTFFADNHELHLIPGKSDVLMEVAQVAEKITWIRFVYQVRRHG